MKELCHKCGVVEKTTRDDAGHIRCGQCGAYIRTPDRALKIKKE